MIYIPMMTELVGPFPRAFVADTDTMILPLIGKHDSGREVAQTSEQDTGEMIIVLDGSLGFRHVLHCARAHLKVPVCSLV